MKVLDEAFVKLDKYVTFDIIYVKDITAGVIVPIIVANSYINPVDYIYDIQTALSESEGDYECIIFDLFLCNVDSNRRFVRVCMEGGNICISKYEYVKKIPYYVVMIIAQYYKDNVSNIDNSNLNNVQKFLFKNELRAGIGYWNMLSGIEVIGRDKGCDWSRFCGGG